MRSILFLTGMPWMRQGSFFGADTGACVWHEGWLDIDEEVSVDPSYKEDAERWQVPVRSQKEGVTVP